MTTNDRLQPYSADAEKGLVGAILVNPDMFGDVSNYVSSGDLYIETYQWIYSAIEKLISNNIAVDLITVMDQLSKDKKLDAVGGIVFLTDLITAFPNSMHAVSYAKIVKENKIRRDLINGASDAVKIATNQDLSAEELTDKAQEIFFEIGARSAGHRILTGEEVMNNYQDRMEEVQAGTIKPVPTGLIDLDKKLSGGLGPHVYTVAGRSGMGKSIFLQTVHKNMMEAGYCVGVFSMEMEDYQWVNRIIPKDVGATSNELDIVNGLSTSQIDDLINRVIPLYSNQYKWVLDREPDLSLEQFQILSRQMKHKHDVDIILIDYIQLMTAGGSRNMTRQQEIGKIMRGMRLQAKELGIPILLAAQISRRTEERQDKRPMLSDLREGGDIEQESYGVFLLYRDEYYDPATLDKNIVEVNVAKNRSGELGAIKAFFSTKHTRFENAVTRTVNLNPQPAHNNQAVPYIPF